MNNKDLCRDTSDECIFEFPHQESQDKFSHVGFTCQSAEANDKEVYNMIDDVIYQVLGSNGLAEIIKPGDKVIIKVNMVGPNIGERGEKGRGVITDPRIVRYVAEKVRKIIGFEGTADLKVVDSTFYNDSNPSLKYMKSSFHWARLERTGDNAIDKEDFCYDYNGDGILDGTSKAKLVNLDSIGEDGRQLYKIRLADGNIVKVAFPKIFRKKEEANGSHEYCDVLIGLPIFKSHGLLGITGAIKLHYGIRSIYGILGDTGRWGHDGMYYDATGNHCKKKLIDYLCAQQIIRSYDLVIMDCLTANRQGPVAPAGGISYTPDPDMKIDYILTNAIMASKDSVAIDTVEAAFAGYKQDSIEILQAAAENKLGINSPSHIILEGYNAFYIHRKHLYEKYNPLDKYPLQDKHGDACVLESIEAPFVVNIFNAAPEKSPDGLCHINYEIKAIQSNLKLSISRVELVVNGVVAKYKTKGNLLSGQFVFEPSKFNYFKNAYFVCIINAWDDIFNCVRSLEIFVKP